MPQLVMLKTAAGPSGVFRAGCRYTVNPELHKELCGGESPAAIDYGDAVEIAADSGGEVPEEVSEPLAEGARVDKPRPKRKRRSKARARG